MTRVDFHILPHDSLDERVRYVCRLVEKVFKLNKSIYIHVDDEADGRNLDKRLWDFKPEAFLPHRLQNSQQETPIAIGWQDDPGAHQDVIINLSQEIPEFFARFERLIEVVCQESQNLATSRIHYRFYQERGYPLHRHDLRGQPS